MNMRHFLEPIQTLENAAAHIKTNHTINHLINIFS